MKPPARPAVQRSTHGAHPIAALAPLALDPAHVARVGIVRAAFDAVRTDARVDAVMAAAQAESQQSYEAATSASAHLARRTAEAHAKRAASFTRPEDRPPF